MSRAFASSEAKSNGLRIFFAVVGGILLLLFSVYMHIFVCDDSTFMAFVGIRILSFCIALIYVRA